MSRKRGSDPSPAPSENVCVYARVSTDNQVLEGTSIGTQLVRCHDFANQQGWLVVTEIVDEGHSGHFMGRAAIGQIKKLVLAGKFSRIVCTDLDRMHRNLSDGESFYNWLSDRHVEVIHVSSPTMGIMERQMKGVFAEEERRKIRERTMRGRRRIAEEGYWTGGQPPYGYAVDRTGKHQKLIVNETEATVVRRMVALALEARTMNEIADVLNSEGLRPRKSAKWTRALIRLYFKQERCISGEMILYIEPTPVTITVPALVSQVDYLRLQDWLANRSTGPRPRLRFYLLGGARMKGSCGHTMYGMARKPSKVHKHRWDIYTCSVRHTDGSHACQEPNMAVDLVEQTVWGEIKKLMSDPARLAAIAGIQSRDSMSTGRIDLKKLRAECKRLERDTVDVMDRLVAEGVAPVLVAQLSAKRRGALEDKQRLLDQAERWEASRQSNGVRSSKIVELATGMASTFDLLNAEERSTLVRLLGVHVRVIEHVVCGRCDGAGRYYTQGSGRAWPTPCEVCFGFRRIPVLGIAGSMPEVSKMADVNGLEDRHPFEIVRSDMRDVG